MPKKSTRISPKTRKKTKKSFLLASSRFDKRYPLVIGVALMVIGVVAFARSAAVSAEETVILSNGKEVRLGQPVGSLMSTMGQDLDQTSPEALQYPAGVGKHTEAMIYLEQGKVVAIQAFANPENRSVLHRQTKARVGSTKQAVKDRVRARLQDIDPSRDVAKRSGLKVNNTRSISYFLTDPCEANEQIQSLALVLKDKQGILVDKLADTSEIKCGAEAD